MIRRLQRYSGRSAALDNSAVPFQTVLPREEKKNWWCRTASIIVTDLRPTKGDNAHAVKATMYERGRRAPCKRQSNERSGKQNRKRSPNHFTGFVQGLTRIDFVEYDQTWFVFYCKHCLYLALASCKYCPYIAIACVRQMINMECKGYILAYGLSERQFSQAQTWSSRKRCIWLQVSAIDCANRHKYLEHIFSIYTNQSYTS